jgi:iron complex transport system substrate-binding protein
MARERSETTRDGGACELPAIARGRSEDPAASGARSIDRRRFLLGGAIVAVGTLVACDDDDGDDAGASPTTSATDPSDTDTTANDATANDATGADDSAEDGSATTASTAADGPLSFTDDRGETVTFATPPRRVVAWEAIVPALVELGVTPVGVLAFQDPSTNPSFLDAGVDTSALVAVSETYGEVDIEALLALEPDLIVTYTFGEDILTGFTESTTQELAAQVAPVVALDALADVTVGIERMEELAVLLGADLGSSDNVAAAEAFDAAVAGLGELASASPGLTVAFGGVFPTGVFVAPVASYPELRFYEELGLDVFSGETDAAVSFELIGDITADVFLLDDRMTEDELAELGDNAVWEAVPAVAADQAAVGWRFLVTFCKADYTRSMDRIIPLLRDADPTVV